MFYLNNYAIVSTISLHGYPILKFVLKFIYVYSRVIHIMTTRIAQVSIFLVPARNHVVCHQFLHTLGNFLSAQTTENYYKVNKTVIRPIELSVCCNCVQSPLFLLSWLVTARSYQQNIASRGNLRVRVCTCVCVCLCS